MKRERISGKELFFTVGFEPVKEENETDSESRLKLAERIMDIVLDSADWNSYRLFRKGISTCDDASRIANKIMQSAENELQAYYKLKDYILTRRFLYWCYQYQQQKDDGAIGDHTVCELIKAHQERIRHCNESYSLRRVDYQKNTGSKNWYKNGPFEVGGFVLDLVGDSKAIELKQRKEAQTALTRWKLQRNSNATAIQINFAKGKEPKSKEQLETWHEFIVTKSVIDEVFEKINIFFDGIAFLCEEEDDKESFFRKQRQVENDELYINLLTLIDLKINIRNMLLYAIPKDFNCMVNGKSRNAEYLKLELRDKLDKLNLKLDLENYQKAYFNYMRKIS